VQGARIVVFHPKEKAIVPIQPEKVFHKIVIHLFRVQSGGLIPDQEVPEVGLQVQGCIEIRTDFMGGKIGLHALDDMFDLVPALFQQNIEKGPGTSFQLADSDPAKSQVMEPPFIKVVKAALVMIEGLSVHRLPAFIDCTRSLKGLYDTPDSGFQEGYEQSFELVIGKIGCPRCQGFFQGLFKIKSISTGVHDVLGGISTDIHKRPVLPDLIFLIGFADDIMAPVFSPVSF
jgi:hypothetical protein